VNGATGAIGCAVVQLLKERRAVVTAVCDTPNVDPVRRSSQKELVFDSEAGTLGGATGQERARHQRNHQRNGVDSSDLLRRMRQRCQEPTAQGHC
jgi:NADPH:quinone reductase-like Zn-dependent oxidoreductase